MKKPRINWTKESIEESVKGSVSIAQALNKLGILPSPGNYRWFNKCIKKFDIDTSHFTGMAQFGPRPHRRKPLKEILQYGQPLPKGIKERLVAANMLDYNCSGCNISTWKTTVSSDDSLCLHLDHIDGNPINNSLDNLRFLCPNCHSKTDTYCGKKNRGQIPEPRFCQCGVPIWIRSFMCRSCSAKIRTHKIDWPSDTELVSLVTNSNFTAAAKKLGVSDNAIRKHLRAKGIDPKTIHAID